MASFQEDSSKTIEEIRNDLICQICEGRPRPGESHWYRCLNLHLICEDCEADWAKCGCDEPISKNYCKIIEKMLNIKDLKFNCVSTKNGCQEVLTESALEEHESECIYRSIECPKVDVDLGITGKTPKIIRRCYEEFAFKDAFNHYKEETTQLIKCPNPFRRIATMTFKKNGKCAFYFKTEIIGIEIEYDAKPFVCECICFNGIVYFWVYFFGSPNDAKRYSVTMEFYGAKTTTNFKGQVVPIEDFFDDFVNTGKCFSIPKQAFIAQFVNEDLQFEYSLEIKNLKREFKDENCESGISDNDEK